MKEHGNIQMEVDVLRADFEKRNSKWQHCARCVYYLSEITTLTSNLKNSILVLINLQSNPPKRPQSAVTHAVLVKSHPFCMTLHLQLSFYCLLCYNSRAHCLLLQCLCTTSAILAGAYSYFVVSSFKYEEKNSCHDLIPNPHIYIAFYF